MNDKSPSVPAGLATDAFGNSVVDPTKNVLDLVAAAITRQDDLRGALSDRLDTKVDGHVKLSSERYLIIQREFENIERRRIEHKNDTKIAVDAAFTAAKEAVKEQAAASDKAISKSEATVGGQIKAVEATIDDLKARVVKMETHQQTTSDVRVDSRSNIGMIIGIIGLAVAFLSVLVVAANFLSSR